MKKNKPIKIKCRRKEDLSELTIKMLNEKKKES